MSDCTHTSNWWKEMVPCASCGELFSDDESERLARKSERSYPIFTPEQQALIDREEAESRDEQ